MKKLIHFITAIVFLAVVISALPARAVKHTVLVGNFFFNPSSLNVSVGDTIRWQWSAGSHTTTSGVIPSGAASWDSPITSANPVFEYKVTDAGTYNYVCTPHAAMGMVGTFTASVFVPTLSVTPSNRNVTAAAGSTSFTVTSNSAWSTSSNAGWCTVGAGGSGNGSISANYSENTTVTQRVATITVTVSGLPDQTVTVTQAGAAPTLTVGPANQNVAATSGTTNFSVTSNTAWTAASSATWCTVTPSGNGNGMIIATYGANPTNQVRIATITTTVSGLPVQTVTVTQAASTVGMDDQVLSQVQAYPNPTKGAFKLNMGSISDREVEITILDMSGKRILSKVCNGSTEYSFDISSQPKGYYFVRIDMGGSSAVRRIVLID
jgi:plastocyanin